MSLCRVLPETDSEEGLWDRSFRPQTNVLCEALERHGRETGEETPAAEENGKDNSEPASSSGAPGQQDEPEAASEFDASAQAQQPDERTTADATESATSAQTASETREELERPRQPR